MVLDSNSLFFLLGSLLDLPKGTKAGWTLLNNVNALVNESVCIPI
jgi:hypothetical protein